MYKVYVIKSKLKEWYYIGMTNDLKRRIYEHNLGKTKTTKSRKPYVLLHHESFKTRKEARKREKYLKSGIGREWIRNGFKYMHL